MWYYYKTLTQIYILGNTRLLSNTRVLFAACMFSLASIALAALSGTYIFGDSFTDVGNNNFLQYSLAKSNYPWYGIDYSGAQAIGRFTN